MVGPRRNPPPEGGGGSQLVDELTPQSFCACMFDLSQCAGDQRIADYAVLSDRFDFSENETIVTIDGSLEWSATQVSQYIGRQMRSDVR